MIEQLRQAGFQFVGEWLLDGERIKLNFQPQKGLPTVYAFVLGGKVMYIGKTETCMRSRMQGYRNGKGTQRTNIRIRDRVIKALRAGGKVQIMALSPEPLAWKGLPLNTAVGLEAGLISQMKPPWNLLNK